MGDTETSRPSAEQRPHRRLNDLQIAWLQPRPRWSRFTYRVLYLVNNVLMRLLFRVEVHGLTNIPKSKRFILTSNHSSPLDPPLLAFALPLNILEKTFWAGKRSTVMKTGVRRFLSRVTRVIPIANGNNALAAATAVLQQANLVWFPEGRRSTTGKLQSFKPGIVHLLAEQPVIVVPVRIDGAFEAFRDRRVWPRFAARVVIRIGEPCTRDQLGVNETSPRTPEEVLRRLRKLIVSA